MRRVVYLLAASAALTLLSATTIRADEEKIPLDKVPKAVLDAVKAKFKGAKLTGAVREKKEDKIAYEISLKYKGQTIEATVTPAGKIVSFEKSIAIKELPQAVRKAIKAKYPKATIKAAEVLTEGEKVSFEVQLATADKKRIEATLDATGKILNEEKAEK